MGFLVMPSIKVNTTLEPSNAGIGSKLNTAKFTPIKEVIFSKFLKPPTFIASAVTEMVVTVPPSEFIPSAPVKS